MVKIYLRVITILVCILFINNSKAQSISPYYPNFANTIERSQFTFFDLNFVTSKIETYLRFTKTLLDTKPNIKNGEGNIKITYIDKISNNKKSDLLIFDFKVFNIDNEFVVESCKISGSNNSVLDFYMGYWNTKITVDRSKKKFILSNHHLQDNVQFSIINNVTTISITNSTITNKESFIIDFKSKKQKVEDQKIQAEKDKKQDLKNNKLETENISQEIENSRKIELEKKEQLEREKKASHKEIEQFFQVKKRNKGIEFLTEIPNINLKTEIEKFLKTNDNGNYTIKHTSIVELNTEIDHKIEITKFEIPPFIKFMKLTPFGFLVL
jgi:hypothetical protein